MRACSRTTPCQCARTLTRTTASNACRPTFARTLASKSTPIIDTLAIFMRNNRMQFGNLTVLQLLGIAMGIAPAPTISNLFVAFHEMKEALPRLQLCMLYLCRFTNNGFGIWLHHDDPTFNALIWESFQAAVNNRGLRWEFTEGSRSVDFMDVTI
ncbi:hypothetical protein ACHAWF_005311 [Thalassiosira exigua]